jgi:hypothetical protein
MLRIKDKDLNHRKLDIALSESKVWIMTAAVPVDGSKL